MNARRLTALAAAPVLAASLSACISVLPKSNPDQLYSFGAMAEAAPSRAADTAPAGPPVGVLLAAVGFPRASTGDGILTAANGQYAYIAESRWVAPAAVLFREAVERRFDSGAQRAKLIRRGEAGRATIVLRLDVRDFATLYPNGLESAPTVAVSLRARLTRPDGEPIAERGFDARKPVSDNRVSLIAAAYDAAVLEVLNGVVTWTDEAAAALPPTPPREQVRTPAAPVAPAARPRP